jgi:hypothetical protein
VGEDLPRAGFHVERGRQADRMIALYARVSTAGCRGDKEISKGSIDEANSCNHLYNDEKSNVGKMKGICIIGESR